MNVEANGASLYRAEELSSIIISRVMPKGRWCSQLTDNLLSTHLHGVMTLKAETMISSSGSRKLGYDHALRLFTEAMDQLMKEAGEDSDI
jgi:hypothetical protein